MAVADDRAVKAAWDSEDAAFAEVFADERREIRRWRGRGFRNGGPLLAVYRRAERLTEKVKARVEGAEASSDKGADARTWALRSLTRDLRSWRAFRRAVRIKTARPRSARARRAERSARTLWTRAGREAARARKLFRELGLA